MNLEYVDCGDYTIYEDGYVVDHIDGYCGWGYRNGGYREAYVYIGGKKRRMKVHRLVAMAFIPNPLNLPVVNHLDGNKMNNHRDNLEWCTQGRNNIHAIETGLRNVAESNSRRWDDPAFRERTASRISETQKERGASAGRNNPRFKYEIVKDGDVYTAPEFFNKFKDVYGLKHLENLIGNCCAYLKHNLKRKVWLRVGAEPRYAKRE